MKDVANKRILYLKSLVKDPRMKCFCSSWCE